MPRAVLPIPKLLTIREVCEHLGVCERTFHTHWNGVFTDRWPADRRGRGRKGRRVYDDELAAAVETGGGVEPNAKAAVYRVRGLMGRA